MLKRLIFPSINTHGEPIVQLVALEGSLIKTASGVLLPELREKIKSIEKKAGRAYLLLNALGASEFYGDNINGDRFVEYLSDGSKSLLNDDPKTHGFKTFEKFAHVYKHHCNKDPGKSYGSIIHSAYNTGMHRVELLVDVDIEKTADILEKLSNGNSVDISMGCLQPDALVLMSDFSVKRIEDVKVGDFVINRLGNPTKVTELHRRPYNEPLYKVSIKSQKPVFATGNHPYLCLKKNHVKGKIYSNKYLDPKCFKPLNEIDVSKAKWLRADCLTPGDYILTPIDKFENKPEYLTESYARLLGYYLAEGCLYKDKYGNKKGIILSVGKSDQVVTDIVTLNKSIGFKNSPSFSKHSKSIKALTISIHDKDVANFCFGNAGSYAKEKRLSDEVLHWPIEYQKHLIGAFISGDGFIDKAKQSIGLSTSNEQLAGQLQHILARIGILSNIFKLNHRPSKKSVVRIPTTEYVVFIGKEYKNKLVGYSDKIKPVNKVINKSGYRRLLPSGYIVSPIVSIEKELEVYNDIVYNFEVAEAESYVVNGAIVHNCKVPSDFCTYCGHESKTTTDYCEHLQHQMGEVLSDGTKIAALNKYPKFFDISFVFIGADPTAKVMAKIASKDNPYGFPPELCLPSAVISDILGEKDPEEKSATIVKEIPAAVTSIEIVIAKKPIDKKKEDDKKKHSFANLIQKVSAYKKLTPRMSKEDLDALSKFAMPRILSTLTYLGIVLKPEEFQKIALNRFGKNKLADEFWKMGMYFGVGQCDIDDPDMRNVNLIKISPEYVHPDVVKIATKYIEPRSCIQPILLKNILRSIEKTASNSIIIDERHSSMEYLVHPVMSLISTLYSKYASAVGNTLPHEINATIKAFPGLSQVLVDKATDTDDVCNTMLMSNKTAAIPGIDEVTAPIWLSSQSKVASIDLESKIRSLEKTGMSKILGKDLSSLTELDHNVASLASIAGASHLMGLINEQRR